MGGRAARILAHIDMDCFFVSVERALNPRLEGKPVIVGGDPRKRRGVVCSASYEVRPYGIRAGMPLAEAWRRCPQAVFIMARGGVYDKYSKRLYRLLQEFSPLVEMASIDEAYLELTGTERLFGSPVTVGELIQKRIREELQLPCTLGIGTSKIVSKVASSCAKQQGVCYVVPGKERQFLGQLKLEKLPGIGPHLSRQLRLLGLQYVAELQKLGKKELEKTFGKVGKALYQLAIGKDEAEIITEWLPKSVGRSLTLPQDLDDLDEMLAVISLLVEEVGGELRRLGARARTVSLTIRFSDFHTIIRSRTQQRSTNYDLDIFRVAQGLLEQYYAPRKTVRLLGVGTSNLSYHVLQLDWTEQQREERLKRLYASLDRVKQRHGNRAISTARTLLEPKDLGSTPADE